MSKKQRDNHKEKRQMSWKNCNKKALLISKLGACGHPALMNCKTDEERVAVLKTLPAPPKGLMPEAYEIWEAAQSV